MVKKTGKKGTWLIIGVLLFTALYLAPNMFSLIGESLSPSQVDGAYSSNCQVTPTYENDSIIFTPSQCSVQSTVEYSPTYTVYKGDFIINPDNPDIPDNPTAWCGATKNMMYRVRGSDIIYICPGRELLATASFSPSEISAGSIHQAQVPVENDTMVTICMNNPWSGHPGGTPCYVGAHLLLTPPEPELECITNIDCEVNDSNGSIAATCVDNVCEYTPPAEPEPERVCDEGDTKLTPVEHCGELINVNMECVNDTWVLPTLAECEEPDLECVTSAECSVNYECSNGSCVFSSPSQEVVIPEDHGAVFSEKETPQVSPTSVDLRWIGLGALFAVIIAYSYFAGVFKFLKK